MGSSASVAGTPVTRHRRSQAWTLREVQTVAGPSFDNDWFEAHASAGAVSCDALLAEAGGELSMLHRLGHFVVVREGLDSAFADVLDGDGNIAQLASAFRWKSFDRTHVMGQEYEESLRQKRLKTLDGGGVVDDIVVATLSELVEAGHAALKEFPGIIAEAVSRAGLPTDAFIFSETLKERTRIKAKAASDYSERVPGPAISWVFDCVRASYIVDTGKQALQLLKMLLALREAEDGLEVRVCDQ